MEKRLLYVNAISAKHDAFYFGRKCCLLRFQSISTLLDFFSRVPISFNFLIRMVPKIERERESIFKLEIDHSAKPQALQNSTLKRPVHSFNTYLLRNHSTCRFVCWEFTFLKVFSNQNCGFSQFHCYIIHHRTSFYSLLLSILEFDLSCHTFVATLSSKACVYRVGGLDSHVALASGIWCRMFAGKSLKKDIVGI